MDESKAIKIIKQEMGWENKSSTLGAFEEAVKALEEVQKYRAIGTPEECRAAVKRQMESRVLHQGHYDKIEGTIQTCRIIYSADIECLCNQKRYNEAKELEEDMNIMISAMEKQVPKKPTDRCMYKECPACGEVEIEFCKYCPSCGQKLDWRNEE